MNTFQDSSFVGLTISVALVINAIFVVYVIALIVAFMRHRPEEPGQAADFEWHLLIPCRDEASVIGQTLTYLREAFPTTHLWVIDDASEDRTRAIAQRFAARDERMHVVCRDLPDARTGKSEALNEAYRRLVEWLPGGADHEKIVVGVVDADGRPAQNCMDVIAGPQLFGDAGIGAVQIEVRMMNREDRKPFPKAGRIRNFFGRTLVRLQDIEFRAPISAIQMSRTHTRSVCMGGNGQFTRLSALNIAGGPGEPWQGSLLEDFELGLHVMLTGYRTGYTASTWVEQEGLASLPRFIVQRTRWAQGTMQCMRYVGRVWHSKQLGNAGVLELTYYLLQPWVQLLGSVIYPIPVIIFLNNLTLYRAETMEFLRDGGAALFALYLVFGIAQFAVWGVLYWLRCDRTHSLVRCLGWGVGYALMMLLFYVTSWRAFWRLLRRQSGWAKTRRNAETGVSGPIATYS